MPTERDRDLSLEIGHVLFIDIVGYSKLLINEQSELLEHLNGMVRGSEHARAAEAEGKLIRLATGDGVVLVFRNTPEAPARCAVELSRANRQRPALRIRMGIHSGPINEVTDVNQQTNVTGAGINLAQRVMDCGDAGHVLLSKRAADDLATHRHWQPLLHELGECEVKHGVRIAIVNLWSEDIGNPAPPERLKHLVDAIRSPGTPPGTSPRRERKWSMGMMAAGVALAALTIAAWLVVPPAPTGLTSDVPALVVTKFNNLAGEASLEWYGEGLANLVRTNLAQSHHLEIVTTPLSTRRPDITFLKQLSESGIDHLVSGDILPSANGLTVVVRVTEVDSGKDLLTRRIDGLSRDQLLGASDEIAMAVRLELGVPSKEHVDVFAADFATRNPAAYEAYLRGLEELLNYGHKQAEASFRAALELAPDYSMARYRLAQVLATTGRTEEALRNIQQAILESGSLSDREQRYLRAAEACMSRRYTEAIQQYEQLLKAHPLEIEARIYAAQFLSDEHRYSEARAHLTVLSKLDRDNQILWSLLCDVNLHLRNCEGADRAVEQFIRLNPHSANAYHQQGEVHRCRGELNEAIDAYQAAVALDPTQAYTTISLAQMEILRGRNRQGEDRLFRLVEDSNVSASDRIEAAFLLASLQRASGRFSHAANVLASLESDLANEGVREAMALSIRGLSMMEVGRAQEAGKLIDMAVARAPVGPPTRYLFARGLFELARHSTDEVDRVAEQIRKAALPPEDPDRTEEKAAAYLQGMASLQAGDHSKSVERLQRAIDLGGYEYLDYRLGLAEALMQIGRLSEALSLAGQVELATDIVDPRFDLQLDRVRAILLEARIRLAMGNEREAQSLARRFLEYWREADPSLPDLEMARRIAASSERPGTD